MLSEKNQSNITWTGFIEGDSLAQVYASSDVFIFPSPTETFGNVVLEALSSGLPVIGANAGGVQHLINNGVNGFLCEPKNIEEFVSHTTLLLGTLSLRASFSKEAEQFVKTFSWNEIFERLIESFRSVLNRGREFQPNFI